MTIKLDVRVETPLPTLFGPLSIWDESVHYAEEEDKRRDGNEHHDVLVTAGISIRYYAYEDELTFTDDE